MRKAEIIRHCKEHINVCGEFAQVVFKKPGRWGRKSKKKLRRDLPAGEIVGQDIEGNIYILYNARELLKALE